MVLFHDQREERKWHVIYVHTRHEKRIHQEMLAMGFESYLPMKKELHAWSDRKKWVEVPLFTSYVFANITLDERNRVYLLNGFVKFVSSSGKPCIVPQWQIDGIKNMIDSYPEQVEVIDCDYCGIEGMIIGGPLAGLRGKVVDVKNQKRFTMKIEGIEGVLSVTIPASLFRPTPELGCKGASSSGGQERLAQLR